MKLSEIYKEEIGDYKSMGHFCLDHITPKVTIAFAEWLYQNRWFTFEEGFWHFTFEMGTSISKTSYRKNYMKTSEELFEEFLKQYKP